MDITIDHEIRYITDLARIELKLKNSKEPIFKKKFKKFTENSNLLKNYFIKAKKINKIILRPLPYNSKKLYFDQINSLKQNFIRNLKIPKRIKIIESLQIPNFNYVKYRDFKKLIKNYNQFDLNVEWYINHSNLSNYKKVFKYIDLKKNSLCLEISNPNKYTDYIISILQNKNKIKIFVPSFSRLNCFKTKYENFFNKKNVYFITSSAYSFSKWHNLIRTTYKEDKIVFGTDHPFNNNKSLKIYNYFKNI